MNPTLEELEAEESRLWDLFEGATLVYERARAEWVEAKRKADDARLAALIEARLQERLAAERRAA